MQPTGKVITDSEAEQMKSTWLEFCKERDRDQKLSLASEEEQIDWSDYVAKNYTDPLPVASEQKSWMD